MTADQDLLGWYHIDAAWNLYVDGDLTEVHVSWICVDEPPEGSDHDYHVDHYATDGGLITSLRLESDDIEPKVRDRESEDRPWHI